MILFPNAKINLGLNIIRRRPDGYHDLETVMVPVPWCDVLEIVPGSGNRTTLSVTGRPMGECPFEKNLVIKALRALEKEVGELPPLDIYLEKIIPDGAGLGGGSADASFALRGFNEVLGLGLGPDRLAAISARVGADCPVFVYNRPAWCTGTGTDVAPVDVPSLKGYTLAIAKPRSAAVSTAEAYAGITSREPQCSCLDIVALPPEQWRDRLHNDFEETIFALRPEVAAVKKQFYDSGAVYASMSGSGAAVYALFADDNLAHSAIAAIDGCDTFLSQFGRY